MDFLQVRFLDNVVQDWLLAVGVASSIFLLLWTLKFVLGKRWKRTAESTPIVLDDWVVGMLGKTRLPFLAAASLWIGTLSLQIEPEWRGRITAGAAIVLLLQAGFWINGLIAAWVDRTRRKKLDQDPGAVTSLGAINFILKLLTWTVILLVALDNLGIDVTTFVAGLGIGGIAVALALQNVLSDLFASMSIVLDKPFQVGDFIIVGDLLGTVETIGIKTTRVRSLGGEQLVFSNADLLGSRIRNYKRMFERRVVFSVGATYETPFEKVRAIPGALREIVSAQEQVRFDRAHFQRFGASSLDFEVVYYVLSPDFNLHMDIQQAINLKILERFQEMGVSFAYPTQTVWLAKTAN